MCCPRLKVKVFVTVPNRHIERQGEKPAIMEKDEKTAHAFEQSILQAFMLFQLYMWNVTEKVG